MQSAQVGGFLSYDSTLGHVLLDRRLYLPEGLARTCRKRAEMLAEVVFQAKPRLARSLWRRTKRQQARHSHYRRRSPTGASLTPPTSYPV